MLDRQGSRFALEVLFLAALATGLALAKLHALVIVGAMAVGWIVVALLEWAAWRGEPHYGSGLPPRYYIPRTSLPPAQPLEQVFAGYPDPQREEAPTWIASADLRAQMHGDWPVAAPNRPSSGDDEATNVEPVRLPVAPELPEPASTPLVAAAPPPAPVALPPLPAVGRQYGVASHQLEPFAPPAGRRLLRRTSPDLFVVEVPARAVPLLLPGQAPR